MLDSKKCDADLGFQIHEYLKKKKVETPLFINESGPNEKIIFIKDRFTEILKCLGLNIKDDSLAETPARIAKMYVQETLWGLDYNNFPKIMTVENKMNFTSMVVERKINVVSLCEHHFQNIIGKAWVAYIPDKRIIGLSKLNRVVEFFSRRPQVQERLMEQIYYALSYVLKTENIAITIVAKHFCIQARGVEDHESDTVTTKIGGLFMDDLSVREEYYNAIKL